MRLEVRGLHRRHIGPTKRISDQKLERLEVVFHVHLQGLEYAADHLVVPDGHGQFHHLPVVQVPPDIGESLVRGPVAF